MGSVLPPFGELNIIFRVRKGRSVLHNIIDAVLLVATRLKFTEKATQSEYQHYRVGNRGHGDHRASREAGNGAHDD